MDLGKAILAFSGGKDSVALSKFMIERGYHLPHVAVISSELDYKVHIQFIKDYCSSKNIELILIDRVKYGIDFLMKNNQYIFPSNSKIKGMWFKLFQQNGLIEYSEKNDVDTVVFGRRTADGNSIKSKYYFLKKNGIAQYFPLRDWSNQETLDFIKDEAHSPIYNTERGILRGTHPVNIANMYGEVNPTDAMSFIKEMEPKKHALMKMLLRKKMQ